MEAKSTTRARVDDELARKLQPDTRSLKEKLVLACRMLGAQGHWHGGLAGQTTARGEQPGTYWTLKFGVGADEATPADLILVDDDLRPLDGVSLPNPAVRFHLWVYRVRPDVQSIVHTHPPAVTALSMTGQRLAVAHMDATPFYDNCGYLDDWPGLPIADNEGEVIAGALGQRPVLSPARHAGIDQLGVARQRHVGAQTQPLHDAGTQALYEHVASFHQAQEDVPVMFTL